MTRPILSRARGAFDVFCYGYDPGSDSRFRNSYAWGRSREGSEEKVVGGPYFRNKMRLEGWDKYRNNEIGRAIGDRIPSYAVWNGLYPVPHTTDKDWNKIASDWWREVYMPRIDYRQLQGVDTVTHQKLMVTQRIYGGDCGFIMLKNGQLEPVEAPRIVTPQKFQADKRVIEGLRFSKGILVGFYVSPRLNGGGIDTTKTKFIPTENFIHCWQPSGRFDQVRGVPDIAPCLNKIRDFDETDEYVFNKIKADATQLWKETTKDGQPGLGARNSYIVSNTDSKDQQKFSKSPWGNTYHKTKDEDLEAFESKTPSAEYVPYLKFGLQQIAACVGISYEILMLIFVEGSFSAQRAAIIHNKHAFIEWHRWIVRTREHRLWSWRIAMEMASGGLPQAPLFENGRSQWDQVSFTLPFFDWMDPDKQSKADERDFNMGKTYIGKLAAERGESREANFDGKEDDITAAIVRAQRINEKHSGANVSWRDIISTKVPGSTTREEAAEQAVQNQKEQAE